MPPAFVDYDRDGDLDAVFGGNDGTLKYFRNEDGSALFTELTGTDNPFDGIDVGDLSKPAFVDIDFDGDMDMIVGRGGGTIARSRTMTACSRR